MTHTYEEIYEEVRKLVEAGEKATQGEWEISDVDFRIQCADRGEEICHPIASTEKDTIEKAYNTQFITQAANASPALKQLLSELDTKDKEIERLKGALENITKTTVDNISEVKAHRALKGGQDDE